MGFIHRSQADGSRPDQACDIVKEAMRGTWPALAEYLFDDHWPEGGARVTSTVLVCVDEGRLKACINDRANERSAWVSGSSLIDLFTTLDAALATDSAAWRASGWRKGKKK